MEPGRGGHSWAPAEPRACISHQPAARREAKCLEIKNKNRVSPCYLLLIYDLKQKDKISFYCTRALGGFSERERINGARTSSCHPEVSLGCLSPEDAHKHSAKLRLTWGGVSGEDRPQRANTQKARPTTPASACCSARLLRFPFSAQRHHGAGKGAEQRLRKQPTKT